MNRIRAALVNPAFWPWMLIAAGALLRIWGLASSQLWYDEAYTRVMVNLPIARMIEATAGDVHPPLYYLILKGLAALFGDSVWVLRGFSAACSILALITYWQFSGDLGLTKPERLLSLALLVFQPVEIYYAKEARMYAWLQLLVLLQLVALYRGQWVRLSAYSLLAIYTHNYGLIYTCVIGLIGLYRYRKNFMNLFSSIAIPGVLWLPWAVVILGQMRRLETSGYWIQPLTLGSVTFDIYQIIAGFNVPEKLIPLAVVCLAAGLTIVIIEAAKQRKVELLAMAIGPLTILIVISVVWHPILLFRGLLPSLPALALLAGIVLANANRRGRLLAVALLVPVALSVVNLGVENQAGHLKSVPLWYPVETGGLPIIHLDDTTMILSQVTPFDYLLDAGCEEEHGALTWRTRAAMGYQVIKLDELPDKFYFSAVLSPLATRCHEDVFNQLIATATPIYVGHDQIETWGVWHAVR